MLVCGALAVVIIAAALRMLRMGTWVGGRGISDIDFLMMPLGLLHGVLFVTYVVLLADVWNRTKWPLKKVAVYFLLALPPFGGLWAHRMLGREEEAGVIAARARREGVVNP